MLNMSSMYDWDHGIVNRNRNILETLAQQETIGKIVAVDFLPIGLKKAVKHYWQSILGGLKGHDIVYGDITSACYKKTSKIYVYSSIDSFYSWKKVARELRRLEKKLQLQNIILWSYNPMFTEFIGTLREELFIFDTVDNWMEHPQYTKLIPKQTLKEKYQTISDKADVIFTVSEELKAFYRDRGRIDGVHWVPNGVDYEHFTNQDIITQETELDFISKPIIGYIGTIEDRLDFDLITYIAEHNPNAVLALCGPIWKSVASRVKRIKEQYSNVITTGRIPYAKAPAYINRFTVGIIPHKINAFIKSTNPMKMYEFLAAGKPIVSTPGAGVGEFKHIITITNDYKGFDTAIKEELEGDTIKKVLKRKEIVKPHSWDARVAAMLVFINHNKGE